MSNGPGTPPAGESASLEVAPESRPLESTEVDEGWFDAESPPLLAESHEQITEAPTPIEPFDLERKADVTREVVVTASIEPSNLGNAHEERVESATTPVGSNSAFPQSLSPVVLRQDGLMASEPPARVPLDPVTTPQPELATKTGPTKAEPSEPEAVDNATAELFQRSDNIAPIVAMVSKPSEVAAKIQPAATIEKPKAGSSRVMPRLLGLGIAAAMAAIAFVWTRPKPPPQAPAMAHESMQSDRGSPATPGVVARDPNPATQSSNTAPMAAGSSDTAADGVPPLATVSNSAAVPPASSNAAPASSAVPIASSESFADAFKKNAAKKDAKWAELKDNSGKADTSAPGAAKAAPGKQTVAKPAQPVSADPLDVLKRLEDARKNKK